MEYTIHQLAQLSGVTVRTLRYYDQIGLLCPARNSSNSYRVYGPSEVDLLQQILFYRELGIALKDIQQILYAPDYDKEKALSSHLKALLQKKQKIELLIQNVTKTISTWKGETDMSDHEKFQGFQKQRIEQNEAAYGKELRERYGDPAIDASNQKFQGMDKAQWETAEALRTQYEALLKEALQQGDPAGETAQKACDLHRRWLCMFWKDGTYTKKAHQGIAQMYLSDERFKNYYEQLSPGCAQFFCDAINLYCAE